MYTRSDVLRYVFMPQMAPRMRELFSTGFAHLAFFIAQIYRAARLIPRGHPCLSIRNMEDYSVRDVMAIASSNLKFTRSSIDQVIVYFAIIAGLVMLCGQFFILLFGFLINPAFAQTKMPDNYGGFFLISDEAAKEDIAFRLLDRVFGVPKIFGSNEATETTFHTALHGLFQIYSTGLLVIAVLIAIYFIVAVLAETAQTGTPFGKRFNHVWAPIRLVVGIGALIPLGYGLNSAQWVTLYAAKFGSGFASNGWKLYHETLEEEYLGSPETLVGTPQVPEFMHLPAFLMLVKTCKLAEEQKRGVGVQVEGTMINPYLVKNSAEGGGGVMMQTKSWDAALKFFNYGDIRIRFGSYNRKLYKNYKGNVFPFCGEMILQTSSLHEPGSKKIQEFYYNLVLELWEGKDFNGFPQKYVDAYAKIPDKEADAPNPGNLKADIYNTLQKRFEDEIKNAVEAQRQTESFNNNLITIEEKTVDIAKYGWGGAGVWYNKIAQVNGDLMTSILNVPRPNIYPYVLDVITKEKQKEDAKVSSDDQKKFEAWHSDGRPVNFPYKEDPAISSTLNEVYKYWYDGKNVRNDPMAMHTSLTGNPFIDAVNAIMGTQGLFNLCKNTLIHPLAQLSMAGKGIMEAAIRNLGFSIAGGALAGAASILQAHQAVPAVLKAASSFYGAVAGVGIIIGFVLFYVVPFMPFLYFFFAVGGWIKGIFEAMVGVPLWALAHLRIDGEGLPGEAAAAGYFLVFEIFVRPILIVFGLIASIAIFSAMAKVLNEIFGLVVSNMSGFDVANTSCGEGNNKNDSGNDAAPGSAAFFRGPIDEFFFTVIYTIIIYMMGMSSFKLIDLIPNNILRWMGRSEPTFGDQAGEPAEGLVQKMSTGGYAVSNSLQQAGQGLGGAVDATAAAIPKGQQ